MTLPDLRARMVHSAKRLPFRPQFYFVSVRLGLAHCVEGLSGVAQGWQGHVCIIRFGRRPAMT